ncbi:hypothetical protein CI109_103587 [Kwoniella shandongensis]|uniref:RING-type domain-containing protein n=1 Tax=Kwoniella shandongensis TaxID=1734106 RepID=A0AAJ8LJS5_9TREE
MPIFARIGDRLSRVLHHVIFSFPSPSNETYPVHEGGAGSGKMSALDEMINEPGETRALAAGVGPMSFAGSGYGVMLVLMAILLNRIHHIVRRPRQPPPVVPQPGQSRYHRVRAAISKLLTNPDTPRYLRLPGLIALTRAWVLFSILLLQVANLWPADFSSRSFYGRALGRVGHWAGDMEMDKICWQVFLSVCAGLVCGGMANGLDRVLQSSVVELDRGVCGSLGLAHFVYSLTTAPLRFPSFTFLTHLVSEIHAASADLQMALFLSIVILFSVVLKAITFLFTYGYIPSIVSLLPHEGVVPNKEDDFGVTLLKIGTACIEATQFSGLRNELATIEQKSAPWVNISATGSDVFKHRPNMLGGFDTEIIDIEVSELQDPHSESVYWREMRAFWQACGSSINNLAWTLIMATPVGRRMVTMTKAAWHSRWWYGPRQWRFWRREAWREPPLTTARRRLAQAVGQAQQRQSRRKVGREEDTPEPSSGTTTAIQLHPDVSYSQFLLGQVEVEDDDENWEDDASSTTSSQSGASEDEDQALYRDLIVTEMDDDEDIQPVLLAHLTSRTSSPLTRRRYAALISNRSPPPHYQGLTEIVQDRRLAAASQARDEDDEERKRACVVCMTQSRDTILWPCRESLASRLSAQDHMCPCCRRKVDGYSRIYIP